MEAALPESLLLLVVLLGNYLVAVLLGNHLVVVLLGNHLVVVFLGNHLVVVLEILLVEEALDSLPGAAPPLEEALEILLGQAGPSYLGAVSESQRVRAQAVGLQPYFDSLAVVPLLRGVLLPSLPRRLVARSISMQQDQLSLQ